MIETIYRVGDKEFKSFADAKLYEMAAGYVMYDETGSRVESFALALYIITTNEAQTNYLKTKYNVDLPGKYGFYVWWNNEQWTRVPNEIVEELVKRFE